MPQELSTRVALLEQGDKRDAKDFSELKEQNAKEHKEIKNHIDSGFEAQASAWKEYERAVDKRIDGQDDKIAEQDTRMDGHDKDIQKVKDKQSAMSIKTSIIWGAIVFLGTAVGGGLIKWGIPALMDYLTKLAQ